MIIDQIEFLTQVDSRILMLFPPKGNASGISNISIRIFFAILIILVATDLQTI